MAWNYNVWAPKIMETNEMKIGKYEKNSLKIYKMVFKAKLKSR